jgi:amino acid transporter
LLRKVNPSWHTPVGSCLAVGIFAFIPMLQYTGAAIVAIAATGMIYLSYLVCNIAVMRARLRGWPRAAAPFSLGKWGIPVTALGLLWGGGMLLNIAWPRVATNPTPNETGKLLNFHWHWLNDRPIFWTVVIVITLVGAAYYVLVQRTKPAHLQAPEGEVYAEQAPEAPSASTA